MIAQSTSTTSSFSLAPSPSAVTYYTQRTIEYDSCLQVLPAQKGPSSVGDSLLTSSAGSDVTVVEPEPPAKDAPAAEKDLVIKKKRHALVRAFKHLRIHVTKARGRRSRAVSQEEVRLTVDIVAPETPSPEIVSNASTDSLTAVHGSPTETPRPFPIIPPFPARDSVVVSKCHEARAHLPPIAEPSSPLRRALLKYLAHVALFVPYILFVGFMPFLLPRALSQVVFSPLVGFATRPLAPMEVFAYHSRTIPWHVGISLALLFAATCALARSFPGLAVSLLAAVVGRTMWAWGDFDTRPRAGAARLGVDDRATVFWLLRGFVLGDLVYSMNDFTKWYEPEESVDAGEEDGEMETLERTNGRRETADFVIRLKDRPHECLRIVVDCEDDC